jgi:hypothetical protein
MTGSSQRLKSWITAALALAATLAVPALAQAQSTKPTVVTGAAANVAPQSALLLGKVTPNGAQTTYLFQYGTTTLYTAGTPVATAGDGTTAVNVVVALADLAPATTYHYRLVAHNRNGTVTGADRVLKTKAQPLGLVLAATPNPVPFGAPTVLSGTLTGTGAANRQIQLQSNPFPYTQGFQPTTNVQLTNAEGGFAFPLLALPLNTQFRVLIPDKPEVISPIVSVGVSVRVATYTSTRRVRTGRVVRFFGTVRPARPGAQYAVQNLRGNRWVTVAGGITHGSAGGVSRYAKRVRIRRGGAYRVFVAVVDGNYVSTAGRTLKVTRIF